MTTRDEPNVHESPVLGAVIRQLREAMNDGRGMSRQVFATAAGMSTSTLQRAEDSEPGTTISTLTRIAKVLGVPLATIYEDAAVRADLPGDAMPAWAQQLIDLLDARLRQIEADQREILRLLQR